MQPSSRLDRLPPYLFAELERKIREKKAAGVDVISLGIGDPDTPTPQPVVDALAAAASDPGTHQYPSNRGRPELREAYARFYERRFGVELDPETEIIPALGAKECVFNLNLAFLDPDSVALAADPGYPVYTGGPLLAGAEAVLMPLVPERGFAPDLDAIGGEVARRARLLYLNYPNNPTGAVAPGGLFERAVEFGREHDVLIVHDASYTETTYDGYVAPSILATPEAVSSYWRLKTNIDSGIFEAVQLAAAAALDAGPPPEMVDVYARRRDLVCDALREIGVDVAPPKGTNYVWAPVPGGHTSASYCEMVLEESGVVISPGSAYGPNGEGFFRISLTIADERLQEAVERLRGSLSR